MTASYSKYPPIVTHWSSGTTPELRRRLYATRCTDTSARRAVYWSIWRIHILLELRRSRSKTKLFFGRQRLTAALRELLLRIASAPSKRCFGLERRRCSIVGRGLESGLYPNVRNIWMSLTLWGLQFLFKFFLYTYINIIKRKISIINDFFLVFRIKIKY